MLHQQSVVAFLSGLRANFLHVNIGISAEKFIEIDRNNNGELDIQDVKYMLEQLGVAKTHMEVKKIISQVDTRGQGTIDYPDFLTMMLGKKNFILKK